MQHRTHPIRNTASIDISPRSITTQANQRIGNIPLHHIVSDIRSIFSSDDDLRRKDTVTINTALQATTGQIAVVWKDSETNTVEDVAYWTPQNKNIAQLRGETELIDIQTNRQYVPSLVEIERVLGKNTSETGLAEYYPTEKHEEYPTIVETPHNDDLNTEMNTVATKRALACIRHWPWENTAKELLAYACQDDVYKPRELDVPSHFTLTNLLRGAGGEVIIVWHDVDSFTSEFTDSITDISWLDCNRKDNRVNVRTHDVRYFTSDSNRDRYSDSDAIHEVLRPSNDVIPSFAHVSFLKHLSDDSITPKILTQTGHGN